VFAHKTVFLQHYQVIIINPVKMPNERNTKNSKGQTNVVGAAVDPNPIPQFFKHSESIELQKEITVLPTIVMNNFTAMMDNCSKSNNKILQKFTELLLDVVRSPRKL